MTTTMLSDIERVLVESGQSIAAMRAYIERTGARTVEAHRLVRACQRRMVPQDEAITRRRALERAAGRFLARAVRS